MTLYLRQESFSHAETILFADETGAVRFRAEGRLLRRGGSAVIADAAGEETARIGRSGSFLAPCFEISRKEEKALLSRRFSLFKPEYRLDPPGWTVSGDFFSRSFTVRKGDARLAEIGFKGKAKIVLFTEGEESLILGIALILLSQLKESVRASV